MAAFMAIATTVAIYAQQLPPQKPVVVTLTVQEATDLYKIVDDAAAPGAVRHNLQQKIQEGFNASQVPDTSHKKK